MHIKVRLWSLHVIVISLLTIFYSNVYAQRLTPKEELENTLSDLKNLDESFRFVKLSGESHFNHFYTKFVLPYKTPENFTHRVVEFLDSYESSQTRPELNFIQSVEFANKFLKYINPSNTFRIIVDVDGEPKYLYKSMAHYAVGFLFNLTYLESTDLTHVEQIKNLKKVVLLNIARFFRTGGNGVSSLLPWENILLSFFYSYHNNFSADLVLKTAHLLGAEVRSKSAQNFEKVAAATMLLELAMLCNARCTTPQYDLNSSVSLDTDQYIRGVFYICENHCQKSYTGLQASGFYSTYLGLLRRIGDPRYIEVRNGQIYADTLRFFSFLKDFYFNIVETPSLIFHFLARTPLEILQFIKMLLIITLFILPIWLLVLAVGIYLLAFKGKKKMRFVIVKNKNILAKKRFFANLRSKCEMIYLSFKHNVSAFGKTVYFNAKSTLIESNTELVYKIGFQAIVVAVTLFFANLRYFFDSYY